MTVKEIIEANRDTILAAKTHDELRATLRALGCATQHRWKKAVKAVSDIGGIDYYAARESAETARKEQLQQAITHSVTLFSDAKARCQRFAICDADGKPVWFGRFFEDDQSFTYGDRNEQSACECAAARKAIWLTSKVKEALGASAIRLHLKVDAQWLCSLSGKAAILASDARRLGVDLCLEWIEGTSNPADKWTTASGFRKWNETPIESLATPIHSDPVPEPPQPATTTSPEIG